MSEVGAILVVSTGFRAPTKARCIASVAAQTGVNWGHVYIEASEQDPPHSVIENQMAAIERFDPLDIVVLLDGDDWLADDRALQTVARAHREGAWVSYGSFRYSDGRPGFAAPYDPSENVRTSPWRATHLKTLRAGLFQRLRQEDLRWARGASVPWDMVVMMAAIEMAGWDRSTFIADILAVYSFATSHEFNATPAERAETSGLEAIVRSRDPYARVDAL